MDIFQTINESPDKSDKLLKTHRALMIVWVASFLITILNGLSVLELLSKNKELISILSESSYLNTKILKFQQTTTQLPVLVEKYAYTLYSKYLQIYWRHLESDNNTNTLVAKLDNYPECKNQLDSIGNDIRTLREQEILALKLIFSAYHVPKEVISPQIVNYQFSDVEKMMSDQEKLKLAQDTLFNIKRQDLLNHVEDALEALRLQVLTTNKAKVVQLENTIFTIELFELFLALALIILIGIVLWIRLILAQAQHAHDS